jgi:hypothetical protein
MSKSRRQLMLEAQNVAALAKIYKPMVPEDVVFVTVATMRGLLTRAGREVEVVALQSSRNPVGLEFRVGCGLYRVHGSPCRLCGGSGEGFVSENVWYGS